MFPSSRECSEISLAQNIILPAESLTEAVPIISSNVSDEVYVSLINTVVPDWSLVESGEDYIRTMVSMYWQKESAMPLLANSYRLTLFMQNAGLSIQGPEYLWVKSNDPWKDNHDNIVLKEGEHACGADFLNLKLPESYVMKGGHCSGCVFLVENGTIMNAPHQAEFEGPNHQIKVSVSDGLEAFCRKYGNNTYTYGDGSNNEWWYNFMPRDVFIERVIYDAKGEIPSDYKVYIMAGEPVYVYLTMCRTCDTGPANQIYYIAEGRWELTPYHFRQRNPSLKLLPTSMCWSHMLEMAKKVSRGIPFVRVDFYDLEFPDRPCEDNIILGEMTFLPMGGAVAARWALGPEMNKIMGQDAAYYFLEAYPCKHRIQWDVSKFDLLIFDLDDLIWKGDVQYTDGGYYQMYHGKEEFGGEKFKISLYRRVRPFLRCLKETKPDIVFAIASHGPDPMKSKLALSYFKLLHLFDEQLQVFQQGQNKIDHFKRIQKASGIEYSKMAFFDNIEKYCDEAKSIGITPFHLQTGFPELHSQG